MGIAATFARIHLGCVCRGIIPEMIYMHAWHEVSLDWVLQLQVVPRLLQSYAVPRLLLLEAAPRSLQLYRSCCNRGLCRGC